MTRPWRIESMRLTRGKVIWRASTTVSTRERAEAELAFYRKHRRVDTWRVFNSKTGEVIE